MLVHVVGYLLGLVNMDLYENRNDKNKFKYISNIILSITISIILVVTLYMTISVKIHVNDNSKHISNKNIRTPLKDTNQTEYINGYIHGYIDGYNYNLFNNTCDGNDKNK